MLVYVGWHESRPCNGKSYSRGPGGTAVRSRGWDRNEVTDLLAAAEAEGGRPYALICLLGLNGLRVSEACGPDVGDLGGARYQPTLRVVGKGDKPAEVPLNPWTHEAFTAQPRPAPDHTVVPATRRRACIAPLTVPRRRLTLMPGAVCAAGDR